MTQTIGRLKPQRPRHAPHLIAVRASLLSSVLGAFFLLRCATAVPTKEAKLTAEQRLANAASFDKVWTTIRDKHWDPTLGGLDWQAVRDELRPRVERAETAGQSRDVLREMVGRLKQSHFAILPADLYRDLDREAPSREDAQAATGGEERSTAGTGAKPERGETGIDVRVVDGAALVSAVRGRPAAGSGVKPGWQILEIKGEDVAAAIRRIAQRSADSSFLDVYSAGAIASRLSGDIGERIPVTFRDGNNEKVPLDLELTKPAGKLTRLGFLPPVHVRLESRRLEGNIGYIALSVFLDPAAVMGELGKAVTSFQDADGIIFDLRGNPGGVAGMVMGVAGFFIAEHGLKLGTMKTRDMTLNFVITPRPETFDGPLAILVDGLTMSASEILAGGMQDLRRARVFGTRTAGAALPSTFERLPNGDGFQFAVASYVGVTGELIEGRGVVPDVEVRLSRAALLAGSDPVIDAARDWISSSGKDACPGADPTRARKAGKLERIGG